MNANPDITAPDSTAHDTSDLHPAEQVRTYWIIFFWLMGLLALTVIAGRIDLDHIVAGLNAAVALTIAIAKALLVILFFMHVKKSSKLTWMFASAAFIWLIIMLSLTFNDYLTRDKITHNPSNAAEATISNTVSH